jgi:nicotinamide riboside kinase
MANDMYKARGGSAFYAQSWEQRPASRNVRGVLNLEGSADGLPVRIGLCGSHGTGKTSLARKLSKEIGIPLIEQVPRTVADMGFHLNEDTTVMSQLAIWLGQVHEQLDYEHFISDRTLLDHYAYATYMVGHRRLGSEKYIINALGNITSNIMYDQYSVIFYLPPKKTIRGNGVRSTDKTFQQEIDKIILNYLDAWEIEFIPLIGTLSAKAEFAMNYLTDTGILDSLDDEIDDDEDFDL